MGKLRFLLALWLAKLSVPALKITRHNGTDFPGSLALKLCPDFLRYVGKPGTIIAVTGTNGKTTVSNLLTDILEADGKKVLSNRSGSNITSGISTALLRGCDLLGRAKPYDMAVLEVDERASVRIFPYVKPDYVVVTNLTRDSIMRNGYIADILTRSIPQTATMILNADDLITCGVAPENRRVYFGVDRLPGDTTRCENLIDDLRICPKCSGKLTYVYRRYHHIGKCVCPDCGFHSPESDYLATDVDMEKGTMALREGGEEHPYRLISDSVPNLYNMVTVIAVLRQLGYSHEAISGYMSRAAVVATRHMEEQVGDVKLVRQMSKEKNALAGSRTFQYIAQRPGTKELLLMMNCLGDAHHWSENTCWIFDADFEYLCNDSVVQLVCTGARCRDYKLRLLMAGVPQERIVCEPDVRFCDAVLGKLLGKQMALGNLQLFFVGIRPQFDDLHAVEQRSGDGVGGVGSRDEHALAQVKRHFDIVVAEARILRRIEDLQKRRRGVALVVAAELVNFVEQQKRVLALCLRDAGHDSAGHGADVGFAVPADFRFVMDAAERDARKPAVQRPRDGDRN